MKLEIKPSTTKAEPDDRAALSRDRIVEALEEKIISGSLRPGTRLDERALAEEFKVSRTPVRDAIGRLASIGLIEVKPRSGSYIAQLELGDILHLFEIMSDLEGLCAKYAAQRIDVDEAAKLRELAESCALAAKEPNGAHACAGYAQANFTFHDMIYRASKNPYLESVTRQARRRCAAYRSHTFRLPGRIKKSAEEHFAIVDAITSGNADEAQSLMRRHVDIQREDYAPFIAMISERSGR